MKQPKFRIAFIAHNEIDLLSLTLAHNLNQLCSGTSYSFDTLLLVDGCEKITKLPFLKLAEQLKIDEIRFRSRVNHSASGDLSNNAHFHILDSPYDYLITIEADVALFRTDKTCDNLAIIDKFFNNTNIPICYKIDDYKCWQWKLKFLKKICKGATHVNRVSSHFLMYKVSLFKEILGHISYDEFYDNDEEWYNYEDLISHKFAYPMGKGIGFLESLPLKVYHCDIKTFPGSPYYSKDIKIKISEFYRHYNNELGRYASDSR